jgi:hypothetical protein
VLFTAKKGNVWDSLWWKENDLGWDLAWLHSALAYYSLDVGGHFYFLFWFCTHPLKAKDEIAKYEHKQRSQRLWWQLLNSSFRLENLPLSIIFIVYYISPLRRLLSPHSAVIRNKKSRCHSILYTPSIGRAEISLPSSLNPVFLPNRNPISCSIKASLD